MHANDHSPAAAGYRAQISKIRSVVMRAMDQRKPLRFQWRDDKGNLRAEDHIPAKPVGRMGITTNNGVTIAFDSIEKVS